MEKTVTLEEALKRIEELERCKGIPKKLYQRFLHHSPVSYTHLDVYKRRGYQFRISPYPGSYRADGAFGQMTTILPEKGLVVSIQCPERGNFDQVKRCLLYTS